MELQIFKNLQDGLLIPSFKIYLSANFNSAILTAGSKKTAALYCNLMNALAQVISMLMFFMNIPLMMNGVLRGCLVFVSQPVLKIKFVIIHLPLPLVTVAT